MWLYRAMPIISTLAIRGYYRLTVGGAAVPRSGPVLLVANHNNSLIDPALVVVSAKRTVRFLAKAPLFTHPQIGWLISAVGSVPVYRQSDDPTKLAQNSDSFRDVHRVLAQDAVVGIFPEGTSHSKSRLEPLKTGASRIALGAAEKIGHAFPIVPVGLVFRDRHAFRSEARVIIGDSFPWDDLAVRGLSDKSAVRELTRRIEAAMRSVTLNLESWEDARIVRAAESVWRAEFGAEVGAASYFERLHTTNKALRALREGGAADWREVARELRAHDRLLSKLGISASELVEEVTPFDALQWLFRRLPLLPVLPIAMLGAVLFWLPKRITVLVGDRLSTAEGPDSLVTFRVLAAAIFFPIWFLLVGVGVSLAFGIAWGLASLAIQPILAYAALAVGERRRHAWLAIRRFFLNRFERSRFDHLRDRQHQLALRLRALLDAAGVA